MEMIIFPIYWSTTKIKMVNNKDQKAPGIMRSTPVNASKPRRRTLWLKQLHQWHWISSAICLVGMLLFALTGITLNHAAQIEAEPRVHRLEATLPRALLAELGTQPATGKGAVPAALREWIGRTWGVEIGDAPAEWSAEELYVSLPRPGGDAWLAIDRMTGDAQYEGTDRGWISYLNDLHKARNTGAAWSWFIDLFSVACLVFCVTGLLLLKLHAGHRPATWPIVGAGLVAPALLAFLFIH